MKQILFVTLSNIGDVVLTTPVLSSLKEQFLDSYITAVVGPKAAGVLQGSRMVQKLVIYDKTAPLWEKAKFIRQLHGRVYDLVVDLRNSAIPFLVFTRKRSPLSRPFKSAGMRERHLEVLSMMRLQPSAQNRFDFFSERDAQSAYKKLSAHGFSPQDTWWVAAPAAASRLKTWQSAGFRFVLKELMAEHPHVKVILMGNIRERPISEALCSLDRSRMINTSGELTIRESSAMISGARLLLCNDSAVMHLGYELNRPVAAIFGPTNHKKYGRQGPHFKIIREDIPCSPCCLAECKFDRQACFEDLAPEKVLTACRELLAIDHRP